MDYKKRVKLQKLKHFLILNLYYKQNHKNFMINLHQHL